MTPKLPARTIGLKTRKKRFLYLALATTFIISVLSFSIHTKLDLGSGRYLLGIAGIVSGLFAVFGCVGLYRLHKEGFVGLFISSQGLNDISTGNTYGMVQWEDIYKIKVVDDLEHMKYKYIVLKVKDPHKYIERETIRPKRRSMMLKHHYYGSPICFSNRALKCTFEELYEMITDYYENYNIRKTEREKEMSAK